MVRLNKSRTVTNPEYKVDYISLFFASGFFTGFSPVASGTVGSAFALLILLSDFFHNFYALLILTAATFLIGLITSNNLIRRYGKDPSVVVIDEIAGMFLALSVFLLFSAKLEIIHVIVLFILFRLFDIIKIFPAAYFDKLDNAFGIMMDDIIAGLYSGLITVILNMLFLQLW